MAGFAVYQQHASKSPTSRSASFATLFIVTTRESWPPQISIQNEPQVLWTMLLFL
jgi:hypothetical protein